MKLPAFYDAVAAVVTVLLLLAVIIYPILEIDTPELIGSAFALALGWTFRANVAVTNGINKLRGGVPNESPSPTTSASPTP